MNSRLPMPVEVRCALCQPCWQRVVNKLAIRTGSAFRDLRRQTASHFARPHEQHGRVACETCIPIFGDVIENP